MKGILFNIEMVRAILDGRKTQTRRNPFFFKFLDGFNPEFTGYTLGEYSTGNIESGVVLYSKNRGCWRPVTEVEKPPYVPGDILYVREIWLKSVEVEPDCGKVEYHYRATPDNFINQAPEGSIKWRQSIHMPKKAARLFLKVTGVRVERLNDITSSELEAEGTTLLGRNTKLAWFSGLWDNIYREKGYGWEVNPWVWVIEFERCEKPNEN